MVMHDGAPPPGKRHRSSAHEQSAIDMDEDADNTDSERDLPNEWALVESELQTIRYDEIHELFYVPYLMWVGQLPCKDIAKAWIKMCHVRKQSQYPYNGGPIAQRERSMRDFGYEGAYTKPDWWPSDWGWEQGFGCRHIEPDHQKKKGRSLMNSRLRIR